MTDQVTPAAVLMHEMAANVDALVEHTLEQIQKPPAGAMADVGHFRTLNTLKKKELEALKTLLEDFAYNVTATVLAMLDGTVEGEEVDLPKTSIALDSEDVTGNLYPSFAQAWDGEE